MKKALIYSIIIALLTLFGCMKNNKRYYTGKPNRENPQPVTSPLDSSMAFRLQARDYLIKGENEKFGYGLYSYLLLPQNLEGDREKSRAMISNYLQLINHINEVKPYVDSISSLNITYLPITKKPPHNFYNRTINKQAEWLLKHYDKARAMIIRSKLGLKDGYYIVSNLTPLTSFNETNPLTSTPGKKRLIQNLNHVSPHVINLWVNEFISQSSKVEYWNEEELNTFSSNLRNVIAVSADGLEEVTYSITELKDLFSDWITTD